MFLSALPPELQAEVEAANAVGARLVMANRLAEGFEVFRRSYERLLAAQPEGGRYHKGLPLHNMGWARMLAGLDQQGGQWTLMAFIEDALSRAEELPQILDELSRPAAQNLRLLGAPEAELLEIARLVRSRVESQELVQDPNILYLTLGLQDRLLRWLGLSRSIPRARVFISSPREVRAERLIVAETCRLLSATLPARVDALMWEGGGLAHPEVQPFPPEITGGGAQAVIDEHVWSRLGGYDIYVGILWRRMGTPTGTWRSGTEAEFRFAIHHRAATNVPRHILFYAKDVRPPTTRTTDTTDFLRELSGLGLVNRFGSRDDFRRASFDHLLALVREQLAS